jgi:mono/diheme cytochrome c family protein/cytochrome c5
MKTKIHSKAYVILFFTCFLTSNIAFAQSQPPNHFVRGTVIALMGTQATLHSNKIKKVALPNARVYLIPFGDRAHPVASTTSDLSGRVLLKTSKKGIFDLCVEADGFTDSCSGKEFRLESNNHNFDEFPISPKIDEKTASVYGSISLRDGHLPRAFYPYLGVNSYVSVELLIANNITYKGFVNNFGEYVIPQVPIADKFSVNFSIDGEVSKREIDPQTGFIAGSSNELSAIFANSSPRIHALTATVNSKVIQVAKPGSQIQLNAVADDPDGDKLEYLWVLPDSTNAVVPTTDSTLIWNVPNVKRRYAITLVARDKRGGYAEKAITIDASNQRAAFGGTVSDPNGTPIERAQVEVNGRLTNTNSKGWFSFNVPIADRYVMNIRKPELESGSTFGYGTASYIYRGSVPVGSWTLRRAQVTTVDPTQPITLQQKRGKRDCQNSRASLIDWTPYLQPGLFDWQDQHGNSQALSDFGKRDAKGVQNVMRMLSRINPNLVKPLSQTTGIGGTIDDRKLPCGRGIKVNIPANSLVETGTNLPPNGNVRLALSTINLTTGDQMPGDYSVLDSSGNLSGMESFGAGSVEIGDASKRYNLKPGAEAKVTIPVDVTQLTGGASLEPTIPLLFYDEKKGVWLPEGKATLTGSGSNTAYTAKVKHFSTINADILKSGQSCVAVEVDSSLDSLRPFNVEVVMQPSVVNPGVIQVRTLNVDTPKTNAIYNLPNNSDIVLTPIVSGTLPDGSTGNVPAGVFVVNTGGPQTGGAGAPVPNPDGTYYAESGGVATGPCASRVILSRLNPPVLSGADEFLQGFSFQSSNITEIAASNPSVATAIEGGAADYYHQADPRDLRASFNLFKSKNLFGQPLAANEVEEDAQYANSGDLGFGRDMHCRKNFKSDIPDDPGIPGDEERYEYACYVTNFGQPPDFFPDQQDANDTSDITKADATVAMEFSRVENPLGDPDEFPDHERAVKFFVYNTNQPDSTVRILKADLDGHGERPVPQLCMVCHGGNLASVAADPGNPTGPKVGAFADRVDITSMHSNFLPFDLHLFNFPATNSKAAQEAAFKALNTDIVKPVSKATTTGDAIIEVIDSAFYPPAGTGAIPQKAEVIANWEPGNATSNRHKFYQNVLAPTCRTCHIAQPFSAPTFNASADFESLISSVQDKVCTRKIMPHAQRTNDVFWQSLNPNMPAFLELYGQTLTGWGSGGNQQCGLFFQPGTVATSTFQSQILPILQTRCSSCHGTAGLANFGVNQAPATVYNELLNTNANDGSKYIVPNNSGTSKLFTRISTAPGRMPAPPNGPPYLDALDLDGDGINDQQEILNWINAGATGP